MELLEANAVQFPDDCLPPEATYSSREALYEAINSWAKPRGYAFVTGRSRTEKTGRITVVYTCDRFRRPPSASISRQRQTTSRSTCCQFSVLAKESLDHTSWSVKHRPDEQFASHNHEPSQHETAHPAHRILSESDKAMISSLTDARVAPKEIRTFLRQNSNTSATQQDMCNYIAESKRQFRKGQSTMQALANQLDEEGFWNRMQLDEDGRVTSVLFAHPNSLAYLQAYPDILLLDCTHKTNKYKMPLLDIIGVDACQRSFCIGFAFLSGQSEEAFQWVFERLRSLYSTCGANLPSIILTDCDIACMNAIKICFPASRHLLCLWHAHKAVLKNCQPSFAATIEGPNAQQESLLAWKEFFSHWLQIISSITEEEYNKNLNAFEDRYIDGHIAQVQYIKTQWLDQYKEKLVKAWVDECSHFGNAVTSRVEGIHALLKGYLKTSILDLFEAWRGIKQALLNQLAGLRENQARQQIRLPIELTSPIFEAIRGRVSHEALRMVEKQRKRLSEDDLPSCTSLFQKSQGLPCAHTIKRLLNRGEVLQLEHFHHHWLLYQQKDQQLLLEPRTQFDRPIQQSTQSESSTRREPRGFESVEAAMQKKAKAAPTCSRCHQTSHSMSSKACPARYDDLLASVQARSAAALRAAVSTAETAALETAASPAASVLAEIVVALESAASPAASPTASPVAPAIAAKAAAPLTMIHELSIGDTLLQEKVGTKRSLAAASRPTRNTERQPTCLCVMTARVMIGVWITSRWASAARRQQV